MKEIFAFLQTNATGIVFGIAIIVMILYIAKYQKRTARVAIMIALANTIFEDLCDPRVSYLHYNFYGDINILKEDLVKKKEKKGPMMYNDQYQFTFIWYAPGASEFETRIVVKLERKTKKGDMVDIYNKIGTIEL